MTRRTLRPFAPLLVLVLWLPIRWHALPPYAVTVTPDNENIGTRDAFTGGYTAVFTVKNLGTVSDLYGLTCHGGAYENVTCTGTSQESASLGPGASTEIEAYYNVISPGASAIYLAASGNASNTGNYTFTVVAPPPTVTFVVPVLTSGSRAVVRNRQPVIRALVTTTGTIIDTTATLLNWRGETVTALARHNRGLIEWEVDSTRWLAVGDSAQIEVRFCTTEPQCTTVTRWAVLPNDSKPVLGFVGMPLEALGRQFGAPLGPGFAVSGAEVETGIGTPAYVSMGAARSAGLVYSTRQSYPRALVNVDFELTWPAGTPDQVKLMLRDGVVKLDSLVVASPTCATGAARRCRATLQGDFSGSTFATPTRKWLTVEALVTSGVTTHSATDSVEVVLVDRRSTIYGSGWWPAGVLKVVAAGNDRLLVGPSGTAAVFRGNGDSVYLSPPADVATTLVKTASGWELRPRGTTAKLVFDSNGRLFKALDPNGNRDSIAYSGSSDQVTSFVDPVGKAIALSYDGNGKLSTITDPGGRQNKVSINAGTNQLTYDSVSSPASRPYTTTFVYHSYPGTNTAAITKRIGVILDTTVVTYDSTFKRRPVKVTLPRVQNEVGSNVTPEIRYTAYEGRGFGVFVSLDSVYVEVKDPRDNWTRSLLNRWGQARKTWDALGTLARTEYSAEGFVRWSEGKVADSSRVYHTFDALSRLARTYFIRGSGDTLRLDSLVYDGNHRVIQRIDARGKIAKVIYDGNGNVTRSITPHNDTTRFWYRANGQIDSTRAPASFVSRRLVYDTIWKNLAKVTAEDTLPLFQTQFDTLGRDSVTDRKVKVSLRPKPPTGCDTAPCWQWHRSEVFFNAAGQVDSTQQRSTIHCSNPCTTAPTWLDPEQQMSVRFDRAGRDSVRFGLAGERTRYAYDRLGRVLARRPWVDSTAVKDSIAYDVAGNVKKTITRRGDTLITNYDSRNRDTLAVIPGVGTRRKSFAGPMDQLTRLWYDSPTDAIGGVNGELRWGYDQRGRLKADTSYTGSAVRATSYTYDAFERRSTMVDPLGTWTTRYEADRGVADSLFTPMGDTVTYTFDERSRAVGPTVRSATNPVQQRTPMWEASGALYSLVNHVALSSGYDPLKYLRNGFTGDESQGALTPLGPIWLEAHGIGTPDTLKDSVTTNADGWVTSWKALKNGSVVTSETYTYHGNTDLGTAAGDEYTYDATTRRLTSRSSGGSTWTYHYDRAGNLDTLTVGGTGWRYVYNALNQLTEVRRNGSVIARYGYDVTGRRIAKRVYSSASGGTVAYTRFVYHGSHVAFETDSAGTIGLRYAWGLAVDDLIAIHDGTNHYYAVQDAIRSVRGLVKRDGTWVLAKRYGPYGAVIEASDNGVPPSWELRYRWTGREYDAETGLYFFRSRYYDVSARRFVQEDAIGYAGGPSLYQYGEGQPLSGRDPDGLRMIDDWYPVVSEMRNYAEWAMNIGSNGGAGGWQDWNGDGLDDWYEFTAYAWGLQQFRANGGTTAEWHRIWYDGILRQEPDVRSVLMRLAYFGDIVVGSLRPGEVARATEREEPTLRERSIYFDPSTNVFDVPTHYFGFILAHELYHHLLVLQGLPYGGDAEERSANCFAQRALGWHPITSRFPCN